MAAEQIGFRLLEGGQQFQDAEGGAQGLLQCWQGSRGQGGEGRGLVLVAKGTGGLGPFEGAGQPGFGEVRGAGDTDPVGLVPHPHGDRTTLSGLELFGLTAIDLHGTVAAAGGAQIPLVDASPTGHGRHGLMQPGGFEVAVLQICHRLLSGEFIPVGGRPVEV